MKSNKLGLLTTKIGSGVTPRGGQSVYQDSGTHLIRSQNIYNHKFEKNGLVCISQEIAEKMKSVEIMKEDVLINITGDSVARVYIVPDEVLPARVNQHVCILRTKPELNPHYLYYFLINPETQNYLLSIAGIGGTRNALTKEMLYNLIIEYPDYPTQEKIVKQLNDIKNKIISLETQNKILEQIAQTIFKSWFVNFDGVTEFEDSKLGKIPKGWKVTNLKETLLLLKDGSHNPPKRVKSGISFIAGASDVKHFKIDFSKCSFITKEDYNEIHKTWEIKKNDVLLTIVGTIGNVAIVTENDLPFSLQRSLAVLRPNEKIDFSFLYFLLNSDKFEHFLYANINPTGQPGIYLGTLGSFEFILPPKSLIDDFSNFSKKIISIIQKNYSVIDHLTNTRDSLLPKLMSGEIRV